MEKKYRVVNESPRSGGSDGSGSSPLEKAFLTQNTIQRHRVEAAKEKFTSAINKIEDNGVSRHKFEEMLKNDMEMSDSFAKETASYVFDNGVDNIPVEKITSECYVTVNAKTHSVEIVKKSDYDPLSRSAKKAAKQGTKVYALSDDYVKSAKFSNSVKAKLSEIKKKGASAEKVGVQSSVYANPAIQGRATGGSASTTADSIVEKAKPSGKPQAEPEVKRAKPSRARTKDTSRPRVAKRKDMPKTKKPPRAKNAGKNAGKAARKAAGKAASAMGAVGAVAGGLKTVASKDTSFGQKIAAVVTTALSFVSTKIKLIAIAVVLAIFVIAGAAAYVCGGVMVIASAISSFFTSEKIEDVDFKDELFGDINYAQYITNKTHEVLGSTFEEAAENSVYTYYVSEKPVLSADANGNSLHIPWYCGVNPGNIDNIWMREECDNITKDDSGLPAFRELEYIDNPEEDDVLKDHHYTSDKDSRKQLSGISSNLEPILSMAHYRYGDEWNFDNYKIAMAYVYAMYVNSHDLAMFDSNAGATNYNQAFHYEYGAVHEASELYKSAVTYDPVTKTVTRPDTDKCDNVFVHTDANNLSFAKDHPYIAKFVSKMVDLTKSIDDDCNNDEKEEGMALLPDKGVNNAVYVTDLGTDSNLCSQVDGGNYYCEGALYFQYGVTDAGDAWLGLEDCTTCHIPEHTHTPECYTCSTEEHTHTDACYGSVLNCSHTHDDSCYKIGKHGLKILNCKHQHDSSCYEKGTTPECGKTEHTHAPLTQAAIDAMVSAGNPNGDITVGDCTYSLTCGKEYHKHQAWQSNLQPGCWRTVAVCPGHCGGHIDPYIDISLVYSFQGLAMCDPGITDASFMTSSDLMDKHILQYSYVSTENYSPRAEIKALFTGGNKAWGSWKKAWQKDMGKWFKPGPNNPFSAIEFVGQEIGSTRLDAASTAWDFVASINNATHGKGWTFDTQKEIDRALKRGGSLAQNLGMDTSRLSKEALETLDLFEEFPGWYTTSDEYSYMILDMDAMSELTSMYGEIEDDYKDGYELWEEFEVEFPLGGVSTLSRQEIEAVMEAIEEVYGDEFTEARKKVVEEALTECGWFTYESNYATHVNGMTRTSGKSECTGFVSGVLYRALGASESPDDNGCGYHWAGRNGSMGVADARCKYNTSANASMSTWCKGDWDSTNWNTARPSGQVYNATALYVQTGSGTNPCSVIARPGDVVTRMGKGSQSGHVMIYLGYYADPLSKDKVPKHHTVECHGGKNGGSEYTHHNQGATMNSYDAIFRPHDYEQN